MLDPTTDQKMVKAGLSGTQVISNLPEAEYFAIKAASNSTLRKNETLTCSLQGSNGLRF